MLYVGWYHKLHKYVSTDLIYCYFWLILRFTLHYYSGSRHVNNLKKETIIQIDTKANTSTTDDSDNACITSSSENPNIENNDEANFLMKTIQTKYL